MARCVMAVGFVIGLLTAATAQQGGSGAAEASAPAEESAAVEKAPRVSEAGRAALAAGRALVAGLRGVHGAERKVALERAAAAHDRIAEQFAGEPAVAAAASFAAAGLWRQHGSLDRAEKDYLRAVAAGGERFAQRGLLGAADMQRRLGRNWKRLHRLVYASGILAILHLVWILRASTLDAWLYGGILFFLLGYRVLHSKVPAVRRFTLRRPSRAGVKNP